MTTTPTWMPPPGQVSSIDTPQREQALALMSQHQSQVDAISADNRLSRDGKAEQIADSWASTQAQLEVLQATEAKGRADRKTHLERHLFGQNVGGTSTPDRVIMIRDAQDRAGRLDDPSAAQDLLTSAQRNSDTALAQAVAAKAAQSGWTDVVNAYGEANPTFKSSLDELSELQAFENSLTSQLGTTMAFHVMQPSGVASHVLRAAATKQGISFR